MTILNTALSLLFISPSLSNSFAVDPLLDVKPSTEASVIPLYCNDNSDGKITGVIFSYPALLCLNRSHPAFLSIIDLEGICRR